MLSELGDCSDIKPYWAALGDWSAAGEIDQLEALGHALVELPDSANHWAFASTLDHVLEYLTLEPSAERAAAAVRIATGGGLPTDEVRRLAAMLAQGQSEDVLLPLLAAVPDDEWGMGTELGACLLHEMVLRHKSVVGVDWRSRLAGHPLADLPLHPLPGESRLPVPLFGAAEDQLLGPSRTDPLPPSGVVPDATRENTPPDMTAAVTSWLRGGNGKAEAAVFTLASQLAPEDLGTRTLESLGMESLAGDGIALRHADLDQVVAMLFSAAASGGAYLGTGGAYGRVATWQSMAALAGGPPDGCVWWIFDAANDWFYRIEWDLGVVCLRPGGHVMAVLAATDTD